MKRLKKIADHDVDSRDAALVIVGDKVYENVTHALCLNDIYKENTLLEIYNSISAVHNSKDVKELIKKKSKNN